MTGSAVIQFGHEQAALFRAFGNFGARGDSPPDSSVDAFMGWLNENYGLELPRLGDFKPGSPEAKLWATKLEFVEPVKSPVEFNAKVLGVWIPVAQMQLELHVFVLETSPKRGRRTQVIKAALPV
ncbi:MAG: hypothetical protein QOJ76_2646 [Acidobacteriota bacterium]|jgi:hypothetical protein|nr:hypothetical protein [Acidobacteriota bacterium]